MSTFAEPDGVQGWESDEKSVFGQSLDPKLNSVETTDVKSLG